MKYFTDDRLLFRVLVAVATGVVLVLLPVVILSLVRAPEARAGWYNDTWAFRMAITVNNSGSGVANQKVKLDIDTRQGVGEAMQNKMQSDCGDSRFTDSDGKILRYFLDTAGGACNTNSTDYYVLIPTIHAGKTIIYHYYGNPTIANGTEGTNFSESTFSPASTSTASEDNVPSPAAYWKLDEAYGTTTNNSISTLYPGSLSGASWQSENMCVSGSCLSFNGTSSIVTVTGTIYGVKSVSFWVKPTETTQYVIDLDGGTHYVWVNSGTVTASGFTSPTIYINGIAGGTFIANRWQQITVVTSTAFDASAIVLGKVSTNYFKGHLDEVKLYQYSRTASQIAGEMTSYGAATQKGQSAVLGVDDDSGRYLSDGLVGYWKMDESSGDAADSSGNAVTLTNNGTTTYVTGKYKNGSEHVPASNQYFSSGSTISGVKTVALWVNPDADTNYYLSLTSSASLTSSSGTVAAGGFANPVIYINGVQGTTIAANVWSHVVVTSETAIDANQFFIGRQGSNYFDGTLDEIRLYNRPLAAGEVSSLFQWAPGPSAYWNMDQSVGTTIADVSGNGGVSQTFVGDVVWSGGKYGSSIGFDGNDDVVKVTETTALDIGATTDSYSIEAFIRTTTNGSGTAAIIAKDDGSGAYPFSLYLNSSEFACFQISDGTNAPSVCGSTALHDGRWHHVAGVRNVTADAIDLFVDGVSVNSASDTTTATAANDDNLSIGNSGTTYTANDFSGQIDEVRLYQYVRTSSHIVEDMNAGHPAPGSPVGSAVSYWTFDEGYGTNAYDKAINANTLTLSSVSWTASGKYGRAWNGTGGNVRVSRSSDPDLEFSATEDFSLSLWYKSDSGNNPAAIEYLLAHGGPSGAAGYALYANVDGTICFGIDDDASWGPAIASCTTTDLYDGTWHHITAIRDYSSTDKTYLYIDGGIKDSDTDTTSATLDANSTFFLGDMDTDDAGSGEEFAGDIDDVKIFRFALTKEDIARLLAQSSAVVLGSVSTDASGNADWSRARGYCVPGDTSSCSGPVLELTMDENTGTSLSDSAGNANTGTLTLGPVWGSGKFGAGVTFRGVDEYISVGDSVQTDLSSNFTLETWFKPKYTFSSTSPSSHQTLLDKGAYNITLDPSDGKLRFYMDSTTSKAWSDVGTSGLVGTTRVGAVYNGELWVIGSFTDLGGDTNRDYIAKWNGSTWSTVTVTPLNNIVVAITVYKGELYIGGLFTDAGGDGNADSIAKWSGSNWVSVGSKGLNSAPRDFAIYKDELYVGGAFTDALGNRLLKWNGSSWSGVGGASGNADVYAITPFRGDLVVSGTFTDLSSTIANDSYIAKWNGTSWSALASGLTGGVNSSTVYKDNLYIGGVFQNAGGDTLADTIAKWDGTSFTNVGSCSHTTGSVYGLATYNGIMYVGSGNLNLCGDASADYITTWNGSSWSNIGGVLNAQVEGFSIYNGELYIFGNFTDANSNTSADRIATYSGGDALVLASTSTSFPINTWQHVAVTYDGSVASLYINGVLENTSSTSITPATNTLALLLGRAYGGQIDVNAGNSDAQSFFGTLDQFVKYDVTRTPAHIAWDYARGAPVAWYKFDECQGITAYNGVVSGSGVAAGMNGTISFGSSDNTATGACNSGVSTEMWADGTTGKYNGSLGFDGTDDSVSISDTSALRFDSAFTDFGVFSWVKRSATGSIHTLISKEDADNDGWRLIVNANDTVTCSVDTIDITSASTIDTNWHHIGCSIDRDGNGQVYIDGRADGAAVAISSEAMATTASVTIGARAYSATNYFSGQIDDLRIYSFSPTLHLVRTIKGESAAVRFGP